MLQQTFLFDLFPKRRYMRMEQKLGSSRTGQLNKDSLNKYKKKTLKEPSLENYKTESSKRTSQNQFHKYFLDTNNVFFQDRDSLKQLKDTKLRLRILLPVWFCLALTYMLISRIHAFEGKCPPNATCKVYIRCNPGYQLSNDGLSCNIKASIIEQIENMCKFEIQNLKLQYGQADCRVNESIINAPPFKDSQKLINSITKDLDRGLKIEAFKRIQSFLMNQTNQNIYQFSLHNGKVVPLVKKHSFSCWLQLISRTIEFKVVLIVVTLSSILIVWWFINYRKDQKAKQIYEYLKQKVINDTKVNITLLSDEIKLIFGTLDQNMWIKIDEERKKDGKIAYFEDQFLFWKLL